MPEAICQLYYTWPCSGKRLQKEPFLLYAGEKGLVLGWIFFQTITITFFIRRFENSTPVRSASFLAVFFTEFFFQTNTYSENFLGFQIVVKESFPVDGEVSWLTEEFPIT
jgi:hypothetical protein